MRYILLYCTLALVCGATTLQAQQATASLPGIWLSGGGGGSENGIHGVLGLSLHLPRNPFTFSVQYADGSQFFDDAPLKKHRMVNALIGLSASESLLMGHLSVGIGYMEGIEHVGWRRDALVDGFLGRHGNFPERAFGHVNFPIRADALIKPFTNAIGIGPYVQASVNPTRSFVSFGIHLSIGNLR